MKTKFLVALISLLLVSLVSATFLSQVNEEAIENTNEVKESQIIDDKAEKAGYVLDEIIVKFKEDKEPFRVIRVSKGKVKEKIKEYLKRGDIVYAEPNYIAHALWSPNDPYYSYQWHLDNSVYGGIQMEEAWDISQGNPSVVVAIIDTGIAYENYGKYCQAPDLANTYFVKGYDFVNNDEHANDDNRHGTHVAGTVAQSTNNEIGVAGVAFKTSLMPVKVLDSGGSGTYANVVKGIRYAADNGAKIISLSLGGSSDSQALKDAVAYAYQKGATVVAACGNDNQPTCYYPAAYDDYVIAVGATQYDETKAPYSNYGPSLDLVAPGGNNNLDQNKDNYADGVLQQTFKNSWYVCNFAYYFLQGTSMATPHVSGVAALLIANGNAVSPGDIRTALQSSAEDKGDSGRDDIYGYGLVDAYAALKWTAGPDTIPPTITINKPSDGSVTNSQEVRFVVKDNVDVAESTIIVTINSAISAVFNPATHCTAGTTEVLCAYSETGIVEGSNTLTVDAKDITTNSATQAKTGFNYDISSPAKVTGLTVIPVSDSQLALSWNVSTESDLHHYNLYRSSSSGGPYVLIASPISNSYSDSGLAASTTYYYVVSAVDKAENEGLVSDEASGTTKQKAAVKCWSGSNQYLYRAADQSRKFCKCAQGTYGYNSYKYSSGTKTLWKYVDPANNENWIVSSLSSYKSIYQVTCTDSKVYPTNQDYYYPK